MPQSSYTIPWHGCSTVVRNIVLVGKRPSAVASRELYPGIVSTFSLLKHYTLPSLGKTGRQQTNVHPPPNPTKCLTTHSFTSSANKSIIITGDGSGIGLRHHRRLCGRRRMCCCCRPALLCRLVDRCRAKRIGPAPLVRRMRHHGLDLARQRLLKGRASLVR